MARGSGGAVSAPIDTDDIRDEINGAEFWQMRAWVEDLLPEVERLRVENTALAATVNELAILFEDHTGAPPHISTGVVEPIR